MLNAFLKFFKEPAPKPLLQDKQLIDRKYKQYRWQIFVMSYLGYVVSYIGRKNLSVANPLICENYNLTKTQLGMLLGAFYFAYAIGKFVNGILADKANVKTFFATGLIMAGVSLLGFSVVMSFTFVNVYTFLVLLSFCWGANGWFQSMTFPTIAKSMSFWFNKEERGAKWSIISTAHQTGVFCSTVIATFAIVKIGLKAAFYVPGLISIAFGIVLLVLLKDKPSTVGLPEIEGYKKKLTKNTKNESLKETETNDENKTSETENLNYFQLLKKYILFNPLVWLLSLSFMFIYLVRTATEDMITTYFHDMRGDKIEICTVKLNVLAWAGVAGTVLSGVISDKLFKSKRTPVNLIFLFGLLLSLFVFMNTPLELAPYLDYVTSAGIGFFCGGLQNLVGLHVVEVCSKNVASAANGFAGTLSYAGAFMATAGTGMVVDNFGWNGGVVYWIVATVIAIAFILGVIPLERKVNSLKLKKS